MAKSERSQGAISRQCSRAMLRGVPDGVFIVREVNVFPGDLELCVQFKGDVRHYRVKWADNVRDAPVDNLSLYEKLTDLINNHCYIQGDDGLCTKLIGFLPNKRTKKYPPRGTA